ncbi:uncharacterized protein FOBCDRAFT_204394 [Fusarium oxysporum Fo47]|uniref:uncharacterized protein n=1 Tax=Fusarium oxysporum Fo47 TaxID=660027 RepID=UPI002869A0D7|nr:uncharacterized protein FOBCDRAFT_204394 [Fusarium oxysporum Fo47]WJG35825.1 hypothetical protein FOBCDRAFT_204394 [Fusarium oxysporum Fo47]
MADGVKKPKWKRTRAPQRCEKDKRVFDGYTNASNTLDLFFYLGDNAPLKLLLGLKKWVRTHNLGDLEDSHTPFTSAQAAAPSLSHIESIFGVELYAGWSSCESEEICCDDADPAMNCGSEELVSKRLYHNWNARLKAYKRAFGPSKACFLRRGSKAGIDL